MHDQTRYARSGELWIAYQVVGDGPVDLLWAPGYMSHIEQNWTWPAYADYLERLASFSRLILFDRRGTGLSDRILELGSFEEMLDDMRAVLDAVSSERAVLFGGAEGGPMCALFAATFPERTSALVLGASYPRRAWAPDYPWGLDEQAQERILAAYETKWGTDAFAVRTTAPSLAEDERFRKWNSQACRFAGTPASARAWFHITMAIDIRDVLPVIRVPTLVIHRSGDRVVPVEAGRYLAEHIPDAKFVELDGVDHYPFAGDSEAMLDEVEEFLTGSRRSREPDRVLATVLFTDIVGSTERAAELGDRRWTELLAEHHRLVRTELDRSRGKVVRVEGDGTLSTFDGPARAVSCAAAIREALRGLGLEIRAGLHTGEIELAETGVEGIAVHIGARVASLAEPGEVLTSSTVKDLVVGSGIEFSDRGTHALKGVPGEWQVYAVSGVGADR
ncbi:MAG: adenylate/guanylate cyclase domain-containing protein [Thermoleophilia bacterium]|nr:adenylate/guanylate cyclase domain-containing protein [Thermoleophilia bacterium]MDH5282163.1 adenylate/guanylate cyclase domain-containing protein [Thermoleophilia bacterium]